MSRLRVMVLAPSCDPQDVSIPYVSYCHAAALAQIHDVTLVVGSRVEDHVRRAKAPFRSIEVVRTPILERVFDWGFQTLFRSNYDSQLLTAYWYPFSLAFEWRAWRQLRRRIFAGEVDVVLRLLPMAPTLASPFAFFLRKGPIPFVIGPLNGGLRSAPGFSQPDKQSDWIKLGFRKLSRLVPFARSTYRHAAAIIAASSHMRAQFAAHREKLFFIPENGISLSQCVADSRKPKPDTKLELIFVGGLVRRKACYLGVRAAAPLLKDDLARFTIIGDGPERSRLEELVKSLGIEKNVFFPGWLSHPEVMKRLRTADVVVLPAVREGGGGVVFEGLANGAVPVILDWGGPGDIVHPNIGYKVNPSDEDRVVMEMTRILTELERNRDLLYSLRERGMSYARECLTWDAKAQATTLVLNWVVRGGLKPDLQWSNMAQVKSVADLEKKSGPQPSDLFTEAMHL